MRVISGRDCGFAYSGFWNLGSGLFSYSQPSTLNLLSMAEFHRSHAFRAELGADAGEEEGFHLFEVKAHRGLGDAEDEVAVFHRHRLAVARDEFAGEFLP